MDNWIHARPAAGETSLRTPRHMLDKRFAVQPLYIQLREALTERIASGVWKAGDALPNEFELAREFGLSPSTVRKALDWMEQARLVSRQQGRGTFVLDQTSDELASRFDCIRGPDGAPIVPDHVETSVIEAEAGEDEQDRLQLEAGALVLRIEQKLVVAGAPFMIERVVLPAALYAAHAPQNGNAYSIVAVAKASGVLLGKGEEHVFMHPATKAVATALAVDAGAWIAELRRTIYTIDGKPAELRHAFCRLGENYYLGNLGL